MVRAGSDREVTPDTPFLAGSISKSFTALAVRQLVEAGEVDLGAELARYLDDSSGQPAGAVTIRQLLSHTSGFSTLQGNASHTDQASGKDALGRRVDALATMDPAHKPGQRWEYSNANYVLLGRLIEVMSGQDYQSYVASNILRPVGMDDSFVEDGETHDAMATGHRPWFATKQPRPETATDRATAPQGGVIASANDLARYMAMMLNGEDDVLSAAGKEQMIRTWWRALGRVQAGRGVHPSNSSLLIVAVTPVLAAGTRSGHCDQSASWLPWIAGASRRNRS